MPIRRVRPFCTGAICLLLLAATAAPAVAATNGVTKDAIKVAYPDIDFEKLKDVGVNLDRGDTEAIFKALADDINAQGGVNGRDLDVAIVTYNLLDQASTEAACVKMTEDLKVFAVLSAFAGPFASVNKCITDHKTALFGGSPELSVAKQTPWISGAATDARSADLFVKLLAEKGIFKGKTIGVSSGIDTEKITKDVLAPALKKAGYPAKVVVINDATDVTQSDANWNVYAEKFQSAGVDHIILVGTETARGFTNLLNHKLKVSVSSPTATNLEGIAQNQTQHPASDYDGAYTITGNTGDETFNSPAVQQCVKTFKKENPSVTVKEPSAVPEGETDWGTGISIACNTLALFKVVAEKAGKNLTNASLIKAAQSMTKNFQYGSSLYNTLGPDKFDANNGFRLAVYDHTIGKTGGLKPLGKVENLGPGTPAS
jgi:ABC-type branched-subunit amino acid transport system substrate-binding protein